jgi:sarcosine oxidase subunit alpha
VTRLGPRPGDGIDRSCEVSFTFDGDRVSGFAGDTIASALYADGRRTFSRSFKYHRRRGLFCATGQCANCLVCVDGAPGVRACTEPAADGLDVRHQNAFPSLERDAMAILDHLPSAALPVGFYYKTFIWPRRLWPVYERVLRGASGLGRLPATQDARTWETEYRRRHADILVSGGGAAGLAAAIAAARLGADVVVADDGLELGGRLVDDGHRDRVLELAGAAAQAGVEVLGRASVLGLYDGLAAIWQGDTLHQVRAARHVFACGTLEQPLLFDGNDLPGVMLSGGAVRLLARQSIRPGERAVVACVGDRGLRAAGALVAGGVDVVAVADARDGACVLAAEGRVGVERVCLLEGDGTLRSVAADLLVVSGGDAPALGLAAQAGARSEWDAARGQSVVVELPASCFIAGSVAGPGDAEASGLAVGLAAAHSLGLGDEASRAREASLAGEGVAGVVATAPLPAGSGGRRCFACLCADVTVKDIEQGVREGYDSLELAKRYTTVTMGPCQGRICQGQSAAVVGRATGAGREIVGSTTARPPWATIPLGALAGRPVEPAKRSAIHAWHRDHGGAVRWTGDWRRAFHYGDAAGEARAVAGAAGLIDVSTLGKLLVRGPQAGELLDRLYPNRISTLGRGRCRYAILTSESGRIRDDGTICRLDGETFYVTTTSTGAAGALQWFRWWQTGWGLDAAVTDVSQGVCAFNLAGPRSREILGEVAELDVSRAGFAYLDGREGVVAGVPCLLLRLGFTGELGFELHCSAAHAEHLWQALVDAGASRGLRVFGLEAQRALRLEKLHILVGADTDAESTPSAAGLDWAVKLDKDEDFVGRWALADAAGAEAESVLVGFRMSGGEPPREGSVVLDAAGAAAGQVTISGHAPRAGGLVGMAWVPVGLAEDGAPITISDEGRRLSATVARAPFFDPEGAVLRS